MQSSMIKNSMRSVISLVDKLRDIHLQSYIPLPKIVAVGSQSSGKSSLIQQIVGLDILPRGSGVVTRRPLQIRMSYQQGLKQAYANFQQLPKQKFTDFQKVKKAIQQLTDKVCGADKQIVDKAIVLNIYSGNCPNLTVIDLPGLTRIGVGLQNQNIHQITTKMIQKYMKEENTIILCVIPANQDITNDQVLHMARKIDTKGERTIGCLTKIDIMDRGTDARNLLLNKGQVPLKLGYVGIKNRSQADINQNKKVKQSLQDQKNFFSKSPIYSSLPPSCLGTTSLVEKLSKVLQNLILNYLPVLLQKIRQKKTKLSQTIKKYGKPLPKNKHQQNIIIWQICNLYLNNFKSSIIGMPSTMKCNQRLQKICNHINEQLFTFLQQQKNNDFIQNLKNQKIHFALRKYDTINQLGFPSMNSFLYLINPLLNDLKIPMQNSLTNICDSMNHISEVITEQVAHQFVKFKQYLNSKAQNIIQQFKKKCSQYLQNMLESQIRGIQYQKLDFDRSDTDPRKYTDLQRKNPLIPVLRKCVINYYKNCVKNLRQLIPKNIKYLILNQSIKKIQFQIFQACLASDKIQSWLQMDSLTKQQRLNNQKQFQVIQKAQQFILTYSGFSRVASNKRNKKRQERQKQMQQVMIKKRQKQKINEQIRIQKQKQKIIQTPKKVQNKIQQKKQDKGGFLDFFKKTEKAQYTAPKPQSKQINQKQIPTQNPNLKQKPAENKTNVFAQLFGTTEVKAQNKVQSQNKDNQSHRKPIFTQNVKQDQALKNKYNKQMGKATDKGVDELFKNQKFQQQSRKAVQKGSSAAIQKQFGVSQKTGNLLGQGAGWVWGQQKTQNLVKDQAKKQAKDKTQL